mgnify:CR=1 FL=1
MCSHSIYFVPSILQTNLASYPLPPSPPSDYGPDYKLHLPVSNMENLNTKPYLESIKQQLFEILSNVSPTGAQIQTGQPGTSLPPSLPPSLPSLPPSSSSTFPPMILRISLLYTIASVFLIPSFRSIRAETALT